MSRKLSFYANISKFYLRQSILASSGLFRGERYQKNEPLKAEERFVKASFLTAYAKIMRGSKSKFNQKDKSSESCAIYQNFRKFDKH